jgi:hypothetical protein
MRNCASENPYSRMVVMDPGPAASRRPAMTTEVKDTPPHSRGATSGSCNSVALGNQRAQGMPGAQPHPQPCVQKEQKRTQANQAGPKSHGTPCAMALRLLRDLPGVSGFLVPVVRRSLRFGRKAEIASRRT